MKDAVEVQSFFTKSGIKKSCAKTADGSVQSSTSTSASQCCDNSVSDTNQSTSSASGEKDCSSKRKPKLQTAIDCNILSSKALKLKLYGQYPLLVKDLNLIFRTMFSDSHTAQEFELGADKLKYVTNWGVAPYFKDLLIKAQLHTSDFMVISLDESLNYSTQNCQMVIFLWFWNHKEEKVDVRYWDSRFLGHAAHKDLLKHFSSALEGIDLSKIIQVSMDGPSVNWKFYDELVKQRQEMELHQLINIGSCGLHIIHGAFKTGVEKTDWCIKNTLKVVFKYCMILLPEGQITPA